MPERRSVTAKNQFDAETNAKAAGFGWPIVAPREIANSDTWEAWYKSALNMPGFSFGCENCGERPAVSTGLCSECIANAEAYSATDAKNDYPIETVYTSPARWRI